MTQIFSNNHRSSIEQKAGCSICWDKIEEDILAGGEGDAKRVMFACKSVLGLLVTGEKSFSYIYNESGDADIDLYLAVTSLLLNDKIIGPHPYEVDGDWSHKARYSLKQ